MANLNIFTARYARFVFSAGLPTNPSSHMDEFRERNKKWYPHEGNYKFQKFYKIIDRNMRMFAILDDSGVRREFPWNVMGFRFSLRKM